MDHYYKISIIESVKIIKHTELPETGINIFKNFALKRSKEDPYSFYAHEESLNCQSKNLIGPIKTVVTLYKAGEKSQMKINGWTFPSRYTEIFEVHMKWADCNMSFNCTAPSGQSVRVWFNWGEPGTMKKIIKAISYLINYKGVIPESIWFYKDKIVI